MTCRQWALGGALAALGATAWWYWQALPPPAPVATAERQPDYVADDLQAVTMDAAGRPVRQLRAVRLRHYPDDGSSELDEPVLWLHEAEQPAWRIRADRGWIARAGDEARLSGAVRAERAASATARALRFETSALRLWPETRQAETDRPVALHDSGGDWVTAEHGMRVWWGEALRVELRGRARARLSVVADGAAAPVAP